MPHTVSPTLKLGDKGAEVVNLQRLLAHGKTIACTYDRDFRSKEFLGESLIDQGVVLAWPMALPVTNV